MVTKTSQQSMLRNKNTYIIYIFNIMLSLVLKLSLLATMENKNQSHSYTFVPKNKIKEEKTKKKKITDTCKRRLQVGLWIQTRIFLSLNLTEFLNKQKVRKEEKRSLIDLFSIQ